eukprot:1182880-Prorocentrum_minimum.AAC.3
MPIVSPALERPQASRRNKQGCENRIPVPACEPRNFIALYILMSKNCTPSEQTRPVWPSKPYFETLGSASIACDHPSSDPSALTSTALLAFRVARVYKRRHRSPRRVTMTLTLKQFAGWDIER